MTTTDDDGRDNFGSDGAHGAASEEEREMERLRNVLRTSRAHLDRVAAQAGRRVGGSCDEGGDPTALGGKKRKRAKKTIKSTDGDIDNDDDDDNNNNIDADTKIEHGANDDVGNSIFSPEMQAEMEVLAGGGDNALVVMPPRKKKKRPSKRVELTAEEIKAARARHKNATRKLRQLADRAEQKKRRAKLYATLRENAISHEEMALLSSSSTLGKRVSKKERLQQLLRMERAGIQLTEEERDLLYTEREMEDAVVGNICAAHDLSGTGTQGEALATNNPTCPMKALPDDGTGKSTKDEKKKKKVKTKKRKEKEQESSEGDYVAAQIGSEDRFTAMAARANIDETPVALEIEDTDTSTAAAAALSPKGKEPLAPTGFDSASFAAQMMAGLSTLKASADADTAELNKKEVAEADAAEAERLRLEEEERKGRKAYVPSESIVIKTAASLGIKPKTTGKKNWRVLPVNRPDEIENARYELPVSAMEFEIIDAVRSSDTTIICAETGSGKSTQVVQMLYEAGLSLGNAMSMSEDEGLLIGVTEPRRVAAVSTAKRVCYEMGHSQDKGQSIQGYKGKGNLVAYQTRYETAGLGENTRVKFMTDGILLSEIQNDLLLRKYGAIILDESHERNINTDTLLGLLSTAIPLRRKASEEGSMPPLKLIIMSATLRIEDFAGNARLFPTSPPKLIRVPGRTHPVTIHHSKVTELDNYTEVAFKKVCKIHRKLPRGGILVFLTGKQEIIRMVNRLRKSLAPKRSRDRRSIGDGAVSTLMNGSEGEYKFTNLGAGALRDMDDDEIDGDIFVDGNQDDDDFHDYISDSDEEEGVDAVEKVAEDASHNGDCPTDVLILPLYSLLSAQDQAKVFEPVPEGTRLIVCATNIAETSLTIPNIAYVVDTGRQKCRNYHSGTGVTSYDVMWISKAAADQRAGRAGRTSEGHCYRLYSSSLYSRHMDPFALPEVLTRPLEDVVLAMKAMDIRSVADFPFPTAPDQGQTNAAIKLLSRIGCVDVSRNEEAGGDGTITRLGAAVAKLPLGVRYGKMLLVAAQAKVLDYGIIAVAVLSESSPFAHQADETTIDLNGDRDPGAREDELEGYDEVDRNRILKDKKKKRKERKRKWSHRGGDILASVLAVGAYTYAGRGAGGATEITACKKFCEENGLNYVIMERIQKMRKHLAKLAMTRLGTADGVAAKTGGVLVSMPPPNKLQENLLMQVGKTARECVS